MLRTLVVVLLLANAGYFAWTRGWLITLGLAPVEQAEPQRLSQQINPDAMRLLDTTEPTAVAAVAAPVQTASNPVAVASAPAASPASAPAPASASASASAPAPASPPASPAVSAPSSAFASAPIAAPASAASAAVASVVPGGQCLQAGLFSDVQVNALRPRLQSTLPEGSWAFSPVVEPSRWIIYMGRYANEEMVAKKRNELRARGVKFEPVQNPSLNPGLSLGHFDNKLDADRELAKDAERGVRTARVIQERPEVRGQRLTLPAVDAALQRQLNTLKPPLAGKALVNCS